MKIKFFLLILLLPFGVLLSQSDPLPSWNDSKVKSNIIDFVTSVTDVKNTLYVKPYDRIATFDNDGTLWCEMPTIQVAYTFEKVKEMFPSHPEWKDEKIFTALIDGDKEYIDQDIEDGGKGLMKVLAATNTGMTLEVFQKEVSEFFAKAKHPKFDVPFTKVYYVPMLELINYLKANEFEVFICSGGGLDFMRVISNEVYGIPTQNVIGSFGKSKFEITDGNAEIMKLPDPVLINDKAGKPVGIDYFIGRKPVFSAGNVRSGGDIEMSEYCQSNSLPSIQLIVNHDDAVREFEYSEKGNESLDAAAKNNWNVVSIKNDWKKIFEFE
ncbi:MAG TPA: HAD family hydrolase [Ignavibacteria bacterium]|nr:HAD family hydrolase [Ignavibacteria bacterium]HMR39276.1 HAD family hydrolase [Ignavibacteria bacterium]